MPATSHSVKSAPTPAPQQPMSQNVPECPIDENADRETCEAPASDSSLTERQQTALEMMLSGATDVAIAARLGVSRRTVYRWRMEHAGFRAQLAALRAEMYAQATDRFRMMLTAAMDVLERQVQDRYAPTALRAARTLLALGRVGAAVADASAERKRPEPAPASGSPGA